jgi:hypothetical protein
MSTTSYDSVFGFRTSRLTIPPGASQAVFVDGIAGQNTLVIKYFSGGTLEILGATIVNGVQTTLAPLDLAGLNGTGYLMTAAETLIFQGDPRFYLSATSATTVVMVLRGMGQGF